jgi:glycosyltransferase involved in cell wall biosynthesis
VHILFHAPMKPPDHPVPSGDRAMARAFIRLFETAGHDVTVASRFRSFLKNPGDLDGLKDTAALEVAQLIGQFAGSKGRPDLCFTYHNYYKAPDLIGPDVAQGLGIPYVLAEASHAEKRAHGAWALAHRAALHATQRAELHLCLTDTDRAGLASILPDERLVAFPPFIDHAAFAEKPRMQQDSEALRLITVGMMRQRAKLDSYTALAGALSHLPDKGWHLTIIGDGPERAAVEALFSAFGSRVDFAGALPQDAVATQLANADLFVWPGRDEAYGLVFLEAQAAGLPVVSEAFRAHQAVMLPGETGLVSPIGDAVGFAASIERIIDDRDLRARIGKAAQNFVANSRSDQAALPQLAAALDRVVGIPARPKPPQRTTGQDWPLTRAALDGVSGGEGRVSVWLRDDDAVAPTPALDRLIETTKQYGVPLVLAVIPAYATEALGQRVSSEQSVWCAPHGWSHTDRAGADEKRSEYAANRTDDAVKTELRAGWQRVSDLFGERSLPLSVPPWNRIATGHLQSLVEAGLGGLSTFGWPKEGADQVDGLVLRPTHLDMMQWGAARGGRSEDALDAELAMHIVRYASNLSIPIGLLTHHLVHDAVAWDTLDRLLEMLSGHAAVQFVSPPQLFG